MIINIKGPGVGAAVNKCELPDNVVWKELLPEVVTALKIPPILPENEGKYETDSKLTGSTLDPSKSLKVQGIPEGDTLTMRLETIVSGI